MSNAEPSRGRPNENTQQLVHLIHHLLLTLVVYPRYHQTHSKQPEADNRPINEHKEQAVSNQRASTQSPPARRATP
eukprot:5123749-Prorocentrum_lima.AAC.1